MPDSIPRVSKKQLMIVCQRPDSNWWPIPTAHLVPQDYGLDTDDLLGNTYGSVLVSKSEHNCDFISPADSSSPRLRLSQRQLLANDHAVQCRWMDSVKSIVDSTGVRNAFRPYCCLAG
jgi:hypothetical protein